MSNETYSIYSEDQYYDPARMDAEEFLKDHPNLENDSDELEWGFPRGFPNEPPTNFGEV